MARFRADEVDNYGGQGGAGFFYLKNDRDTAKVRFLYRNVEDIEGFSVHEVELDGKKRYVNCLRNYNDPIDKCPFCREKMFTSAKLFIPLYDEDSKTVKIWERGKKFFGRISNLVSRYQNTVSHSFEIERNGKVGDPGTTYEIYEIGSDDSTLEDFPEQPSILGGLVLDKSVEDMNYYLREGHFPSDDEEEEPVRRRRSDRSSSDEDRPVRRTPANENRRREAF